MSSSSKSFSFKYWPLFVVAAVMGGVLLRGGDSFLARHARVSFDTAGLDVERVNWDTLRLQPRFVSHTSLGGRRTLRPETTSVHLFDAEYDTLYAGAAAGVIPLPDRQLASREPVLIEVCGRFRSRDERRSEAPSSRGGRAYHQLCEQTTVLGSPKRVRAVESDITFPEDGAFQRGRYDVRLVVERRAFRDTTWEPLETEAASSYLVAQSESASGQAAVRVPIRTGGQGTFDLSRYDGYDDFQYHLRSAMEGGEERREGATPTAAVSFEIQAALSGAPPQPVRRLRKEVHRLTPRERRRQVQRFAYSAAEEIARRLLPEEWEDVRATVHDWNYNRIEGRYEIDLRVRWFERDDFDDRYVLEGTLSVQEGNRTADFAGERGNQRAVRRWRRAVQGDQLPLGTLKEPAEDEELPEVEGQGLRDLADRRYEGRPRDGGRSPRSPRRH